MGNHAHLGPKLPAFIEVNAPGIAATFGEYFKFMPTGMIAPNTGIHPLTLALRRAGLSDVAGTENAMATIEPAVGTPRKSVKNLVGISGIVPAIQEKLRITSRFWV